MDTHTGKVANFVTNQFVEGFNQTLHLHYDRQFRL
jgi:hypothetical protein